MLAQQLLEIGFFWLEEATGQITSSKSAALMSPLENF
jgi:hypothetical protein